MEVSSLLDLNFIHYTLFDRRSGFKPQKGQFEINSNLGILIKVSYEDFDVSKIKFYNYIFIFKLVAL